MDAKAVKQILRLLTICLEMVAFGTNWETRHSWLVNKLARSVTKWTRACDRRFARLVYYIHHTNDRRQYCHVGSTAQHCRLGLFQNSNIWRLGGFKINVGWSLMYLRKPNICDNQSSVQETKVSIQQFYGG